jgi:kynurenine formamidase
MPVADDVEQAIAAAAARVSNWGRWGEGDVLGTLNHIDADKRREAAGLVRSGESYSLSIEFNKAGPQGGGDGRFNPVHTMSIVVDGSPATAAGYPHGFGGADDMLMMPMQAATHWDGLGHIFDHGRAWNGRFAPDVVGVAGDGVTGIERVSHAFVTRAVLLDVGAALADGELPDGFAVSPEQLEQTIEAQGPSSVVGRGDVVLLRTGQLGRCRRDGWDQYAGGPAPGLSFATLDWIHQREIAAVASDTWGVEVRPNEFSGAFQPWHQVAIPHIGLYVGEIFDLDRLALACRADGRYDCLLVAAPLAVTGGVGAPTNPVAVR